LYIFQVFLIEDLVSLGLLALFLSMLIDDMVAPFHFLLFELRTDFVADELELFLARCRDCFI
jgi:hypothetical protein